MTNIYSTKTATSILHHRALYIGASADKLIMTIVKLFTLCFTQHTRGQDVTEECRTKSP